MACQDGQHPAEAAEAEGRKLAAVGAPKGNTNAAKINPYVVRVDSGNQQYGNRADYLRARLERDNPEVLADLDAGKLCCVIVILSQTQIKACAVAGLYVAIDRCSGKRSMA